MPPPPSTKRAHLRQLVEEKNRWSGRQLTDEERALGFLGWHERGYLPHCDFPNLIQFVTFRLEDSMPVARRGEWEHMLKIDDVRDRRTKLEEYLDRGIGECHLRDARIAKLVEDTLLHFHKDRYELLGWCVMPNHVHVLVEIWQTPLAELVHTWKRFIAREANKALGRTEPFWEREYWDTKMRDEAQLHRARRYIQNNPTKAKLVLDPADWPWSSATGQSMEGNPK